MNNLKSKDLLAIRDLSIEEIDLIFETAIKFKEVLSRPIKKVPSLRHLTVANVFFENSTRTKLSFEIAPYILKKINNKKIPLMADLLKVISKNKKLNIRW